MSASYCFLPWVRRGAVAAVTGVDPLDAPLPARAALDVVLHVTDTGEHVGDVRPQLAVLGPGEAVRLAPGAVAGTHPTPGENSADAESFPAVELRDPDLPWLLTPAAPDDRGRLRPWLCLVVLSGPDGPPDVRPGAVGASPSVTAAVDQLPDLGESWAWAHAQVVLDDGEDVRTVLAEHPERALSRLLCPQRLAPHRAYRACVVPTTDAGRRAGLGLAPDGDVLRPAWTTGGGAAVELPVYHQWTFRTGARGDWEQLVDQLTPRPLPPGVGSRTVRLVDFPDDLPDPGVLHLGGALRAPGSPPADDDDALDAWAAAFRLRLADAIRPGGETPVVAPPVYGARHAGEPGVPAEGEPPRWLAELVTDPRHRAAAGLGALVVQREQTDLVAEAWRQAGELEDAVRVVRHGELAREAARGVHRRHVARLPAGELFLLAGPVHGRTHAPAVAAFARGAPALPPTVRERTRRSPMPQAAASPAFRRALRVGVPSGAPDNGGSDGDNVTEEPEGGTPLDRLADGSLTARPTPPRRGALDDDLDVEEPAEGEEPPPLPPGLDEAVEADRDRFAHLAALARAATAAPAAGPALALDELADALRADLDPDRTVDRALAARVSLDEMRPDEPVHGDLARKRSRPAGRPLAAPVFGRATYRSLVDVSEDLLLPGLSEVPDGTVTLVRTNPAFVEAFLVGLNHEMSREMLWREMPVDLRATTFPWFWPPGPAAISEEREIGGWDGTLSLGQNHPDAAGAARVVTLMRGEFVRRVRKAEVLAARAIRDADGALVPSVEEREPLFEADLDPDVLLVGLDLSVAEARGDDNGDGWFVVLQQPTHDARFGLDPPSDEPTNGPPPTWNTLAWDHLTEGEPLTAGGHVPVVGPLSGVEHDGAEWGRNAAHLARAMLQRPLRVAVHAGHLLPDESEDQP